MSGGHLFSADRNGMEMAEYMTLYLRDQENQEIGMERGLKIGREEALYQAVIKNETYKDITRETVQKYFR